MLDGYLRARLDPALDAAGGRLADIGIGADAVTWTGFAIGAAAAVLIAGGHFAAGLVLILISRLCDGLDGAVARLRGRTDFGGYLDITLDFAFYGLVPLAFAIADPAANAIAGATLLAAFYANGASFLAYAIMAEKRGLESEARGKKSLFFTTGLAEASETIGIFILFCLLPQWFAALAYVFAAVTVYTTISRIALARRSFGQTAPS